MMTDPGREVPLVAGETTYTLYAGNRALRMLERDTGKSVVEIFEDVDQGSVELVTIVLHAMLKRNHPDLDVDDVDDIIDAAGYKAVGEALGKAADRAFAAGEAGGDDAGKVTALNGASPGGGTKSSRARSRPA